MKKAIFLSFILFVSLVGTAQSPACLQKADRPTPALWLVVHGDSITNDDTPSFPPDSAWGHLVYASLVAAHPGQTIGLSNYGVNGQGLGYAYYLPPSNQYGTLIQDGVTRVDPILALPGPIASKYLVIFAGTNDIFLNGKTGAQVAALNLAYVDARLAAGWIPGNICVGTMLPRQTAHEADRSVYNASIRNNAAGRGYKVCDYAANPQIGCAGCEANTAFYFDFIHPNQAGQQILANITTATLFP